MSDRAGTASLSVNELRGALAARGHEFTEEQTKAILQFVKQTGSVEQAQEAIEQLQQLKAAA